MTMEGTLRIVYFQLLRVPTNIILDLLTYVLVAGLSDDVVDTGMLQQIVELLDNRTLMQEYRGVASFMAHWHIVKFLEICIRDNGSNFMATDGPCLPNSNPYQIICTSQTARRRRFATALAPP